MRITNSFIDLDDTIYPSKSGIWQLIKSRVYLFMEQKYGIPYDEAILLSRQYVNDYGTTYKGLCKYHTIDEDEYFNFVHDVPIEEYLTYDSNLVKALENIPGNKYILTNATSPHARRVLNKLNVAHYFNGIIDIKDMAPYCKPAPEAFKKALTIAGEDDPTHCLFVDDLENNTNGAMKLGFHSILFGKTQKTSGCDAAFDNWADIELYVTGK